MLDLKGRTVIEFGPADGVNTGRLIATGARQITAVEGRPENVVKLLAAKYAMGWDNLEILADNFQCRAAGHRVITMPCSLTESCTTA